MDQKNFLIKFTELLERNKPIKPEDRLVDIEELDSLGILLLLSLVDDEYNVTIGREDLKKMRYVQDIILFLNFNAK